MRGDEEKQGHMSSCISPDARVSKSHPLRKIKELAEAAPRKGTGLYPKT
jgi:hypothetical protein